ncbi:MAG: hypothetical protein A3F54_03080 [Candidatus Kerfeldbacteria bacterium RIFCSPHIGHO2_12_FULL_48_17]|uniref:Uncharacterized protein n=1 Tax=Candidatus Kerfeldbacteria bacterium RIFCSPHIGHO2_12_FULL_48_17 TaxID=1798542 RepID=A0A1G2B9T1_9BACT|nr:MAG: hypothetical protein A3F54_03080 [Candidatus Kerfeldbacteria bacterium RIFCSPHIGHO2_12_FULL_48_17]
MQKRSIFDCSFFVLGESSELSVQLLQQQEQGIHGNGKNRGYEDQQNTEIFDDEYFLTHKKTLTDFSEVWSPAVTNAKNP